MWARAGGLLGSRWESDGYEGLDVGEEWELWMSVLCVVYGEVMGRGGVTMLSTC